MNFREMKLSSFMITSGWTWTWQPSFTCTVWLYIIHPSLKLKTTTSLLRFKRRINPWVVISSNLFLASIKYCWFKINFIIIGCQRQRCFSSCAVFLAVSSFPCFNLTITKLSLTAQKTGLCICHRRNLQFSFLSPICFILVCGASDSRKVVIYWVIYMLLFFGSL